MIFIIALLITSSFSMFAPGALSAPSISDYEVLDISTPEAVEKHIERYFTDIPVMKGIAFCESRFRHFDSDGNVLRGDIEPSDIGVMQINEYFHGRKAQVMGIDLYDFGGNLIYARYLYEKEGTEPWKSSKKCWGSQLATK
jgi:hypothetical protein